MLMYPFCSFARSRCKVFRVKARERSSYPIDCGRARTSREPNRLRCLPIVAEAVQHQAGSNWARNVLRSPNGASSARLPVSLLRERAAECSGQLDRREIAWSWRLAA
jgi:hypothetical protein